jgi:hypothetical protein
LLKDPDAKWNYPAITTYDFSEFSVRTQSWRYIHYIDGSEELYDHRSDPEEWDNLADKPEYKELKEKLAGYIPENPAPLADTSYKTMPHHILPLKNKEDYFTRKKLNEEKEKR